MPATRSVTVIPATINPVTKLPATGKAKRRVAGYARVSTDSDEQFTSYEAQVDYYTNFIKENPAWEFVKVYTDEGISGLNTKRREGFNAMIADALAGKIDLIVTKSVSRFARNTVDSLVTVRKLKERGVEVFFQKENIYTLDSKGELLITIMSSLAQEESRSISENVTWGQRKRFADGKVSLPYSHFLGYEKGEDDTPKVVPEQAALVRRIYSLFMEGQTPCGIAKLLTTEGIPSPGGKPQWRTSTVHNILTNEKYKGSALLQKSFTVDFLTKKTKANEGEVPQYFVEHSHEAIIPADEWEAVQAELQRRKALGRRYSSRSPLAARLVCEDCGGFFGPKIWHSNDPYRRVIWQCNSKFKGEHQCQTPHLKEEDIKDRFLKAYNSLLGDRELLLDDCQAILDTLTDCSEIDREREELLREIEVVAELTRRCIEENSTQALDQQEYMERYTGYESRYEAAKTRLARLDEERTSRAAKADAIRGFMKELSEASENCLQFDDRLWLVTVEQATIHRDGSISFVFKGGITVTQ